MLKSANKSNLVELPYVGDRLCFQQEQLAPEIELDRLCSRLTFGESLARQIFSRYL